MGKIRSILLVVAIVGSFGVGLAVPNVFEATYRNHVDIQRVQARTHEDRMNQFIFMELIYREMASRAESRASRESFLHHASGIRARRQLIWGELEREARTNPFSTAQAKLHAEGAVSKEKREKNTRLVSVWQSRLRSLPSASRVRAKDKSDWSNKYGK